MQQTRYAPGFASPQALGDVGAAYVAVHGLAGNRDVGSLDLASNGITATGVAALAQVQNYCRVSHSCDALSPLQSCSWSSGRMLLCFHTKACAAAAVR